MQFTQCGLLPAGDYPMTFSELRNSLLVQGTGQVEPNWDMEHRIFLVNNLEILVNQLWIVNEQHGGNVIGKIYIDGSFVEMKAHPNDIDGYFDCDLQFLANGFLAQSLNEIDPYKIWTWSADSRKSYPGFVKKQLPMWCRYRVELYPHFGQPSGIVDEYGNQQQFPAAFRKTRNTFEPKGIIEIIK